MNNIDPIKFELYKNFELSSGGHKNIDDGACAMEMVSYLANEPFSDHPKCACPVITNFIISWNDSLPHENKQKLIKPLIPKLINTKASLAIEDARSFMALDWYIREFTPAWFKLVPAIADHADKLINLPQISTSTTPHDIYSARTAAENAARTAAWAAAENAARTAAENAARTAAWAAAENAAVLAAWAAAGNAAWNAAWAAAENAARTATRTAARAAAENAARTAAWAAAENAAVLAARTATRTAARAAARTAARSTLDSTVKSLQLSAVNLVHNMINLK